MDLGTVIDYTEAELWTSRWKGYDVHKSAKRGKPQERSVYFGQRCSDSHLIIYDKAAEQGVEGHWTRVELRFRNKRATAAGRLFVDLGDDVGSVSREFAGILRGYLEFKEWGPTRRERWDACGWWLDFLDGAEKGRLVVQPGELPSVGQVQEWLYLQVLPMMGVMVEALGFDEGWGWLFRNTEKCKGRWRARHRAILAASDAGKPVGRAALPQR
mgnify:CR=1 FL=1